MQNPQCLLCLVSKWFLSVKKVLGTFFYLNLWHTIYIREGFQKLKWKLKMAFAMKEGWVGRVLRAIKVFWEKNV